MHPSLRFKGNGVKKRKYPVSSSHVDKNALLLSEDSGQTGFEMIETAAKITTCYKQGMQTFKLLSAKNRKLRLQSVQTHQIWTGVKNAAWAVESQCQLQHLHGKVSLLQTI
ncbi:hypothetical protein GOODEAATRI_012730 [Goodea atripinnis]|uniref:Uncharacterized protein n=1 Tax=Goodea atripinnis TaxID=208336 RepID=A0ABV0P3M7_9TELE